MRLEKIQIQNYRSIIGPITIRLEALQALVGENNAGKSNILKAIGAFLSPGSGGIQPSDFNDGNSPILIECTFSELTELDRNRLKRYLRGDLLTLQKRLELESDTKTGKMKVKSEYHGYSAEPKDWWLSIQKIHDEKGPRPKWSEIAREYGIIEFVAREDGSVTKATYEQGISRYLTEHPEIEFDEPELGATKALGLQAALTAALPEFFLLPGVTDYSDETDRRSTTTAFRRLMGELSDRIMRADPKYQQVEDALALVRKLLNPILDDPGQDMLRLESLSSIETALKDIIARLIPSVRGVELTVAVDETREIFSRGVQLRVDDGVLTDVLDKGHGLQRSVVFGLIQLLIDVIRRGGDEPNEYGRPIILAIEEPELYIHPQLQRLLFNVLKSFSGIDDQRPTNSDQVVYSTHAPAFIDIGNYDRICVLRKDSEASGTKAYQAQKDVLGDVHERDGFRLLNKFGLEHNEMFFASRPILVEGPEDRMAVIAAGRKLGYFTDIPEECGVSVIVTGNKEEIPKFQKVLNAYGLRYSVLLELDGNGEQHEKNAQILGLIGDNQISKIPNKLEELVGQSHFRNQFHARQFFGNDANLSDELLNIVRILF